MPHQMIVVDCGTPPRMLRELERLVAGHPDVAWIRSDRFLNVNEIRNRVAAATDQDYVCFVENACEVEAGWLEALIDACEATGAGIGTPRLEERTPWFRGPHHDQGFGDIAKEERGGRVVRRIVEVRHTGEDRFRLREPALVRTFESHCLLFRRTALSALGPFDEALTAGTHVDMTIAAMEKGITAVFVPGSRVTHRPMVLARGVDRALFRFRWDPARAAASRDAIAAKWAIVEGMPDVGDFAWQQHFRTNPVSWFFSRMFAVTRRVLTRLSPRP